MSDVEKRLFVAGFIIVGIIEVFLKDGNSIEQGIIVIVSLLLIINWCFGYLAYNQKSVGDINE